MNKRITHNTKKKPKTKTCFNESNTITLIRLNNDVYTRQVNSIYIFTPIPHSPITYFIINENIFFSSLHLYIHFSSAYEADDFWQALISFVRQDNVPWRTHNHESNHSTQEKYPFFSKKKIIFISFCILFSA